MNPEAIQTPRDAGEDSTVGQGLLNALALEPGAEVRAIIENDQFVIRVYVRGKVVREGAEGTISRAFRAAGLVGPTL